MATKPKEGAQLKSKSRSAPTTPSSSSQRKRLGPSITPDNDATASMQEKPIPNYLRPTISSGQNSKQQHSESPSKSPIIKKPVEKAASPSSQSKDKARSLKSPLPKPSNSPSWEKASSSSKTVKTAKALTPTPTSSKSSNSKGTSSASATKRKETKATPQGEKVLPDEELKAESSPRHDNAKKNEEENYGIEEKLEETETMLADSSNEEGEDRKVEGANVAFKKEEEAKEKGSPTAYNAVIEETASKLATEKRNKVRALVGAFETVMSMQEVEGQQSPQKGGGGQHGQLKEEKKPEMGQESQQEDNCQHSQQNAGNGVQNQEQAEEKNNQRIEEQEDKSDEAEEG